MSINHAKKQYLDGVRSGVPVILGFIPVGIAYAVMARQTGLTVFETILMSICVFAGASQMMVVGMYAQDASIAAMVLATFILNLRHLIMGICIFTRMKKTGTALKLLAAFGITDESFAIFSTGKEENTTVFNFLGLITVTYSSWIVGTAIGAVATNFLPALLTASLGISLYAMFIGLLTPNITKNGSVAKF